MTLPGVRLDKWLWHARFARTRTLATRLVQARRVRLNRRVVERAATLVRPDDVLTLRLGTGVRVVRVLALAERRGSSPEARALYVDLVPATSPGSESA